MTPQGGLPYPPHWHSLLPVTLDDHVYFVLSLLFVFIISHAPGIFCGFTPQVWLQHFNTGCQPRGVQNSRLWSQMNSCSHTGPTSMPTMGCAHTPSTVQVALAWRTGVRGMWHWAWSTVLATLCTLMKEHNRILMSEQLVAELPPTWPNPWRRECFIFVPECHDR